MSVRGTNASGSESLDVREAERRESADWLSAEQACRLLSIRRGTLYAYVSRGRLASHPGVGRSRWYRREDVERLRSRSEARRSPAGAARGALQWGSPVLDSSLTLIDAGRPWYRGHDVAALAREATFEEVAALLWGASSGGDLFDRSVEPLGVTTDVGGRGGTLLHPGLRLQQVVLDAAREDPSIVSARGPRLERRAARLVHRLVAVAGPVRRRTSGPIDRVLQRAWLPRHDSVRPAIRAALILCADHELNVSSFSVRCVASAGSSLYDSLLAGLGALRGHRHGGHADRCEALFQETGVPAVRWPGDRRRDPVPTRDEIAHRLAARLQRGESIPAFGPHPLYPAGDPRCAVLLEVMREVIGDEPFWRWLDDFVDVGRELLDEEPTIDLGLAVLARALRLPPGGAWTLFALGRSVGWIAHHLEQVQLDRLIRPRARYVGAPPAAGRG